MVFLSINAFVSIIIYDHQAMTDINKRFPTILTKINNAYSHGKSLRNRFGADHFPEKLTVLFLRISSIFFVWCIFVTFAKIK